MKEKIFKKGFTRRLLSVVLAVTMIFTLLPMNIMNVFAADTFKMIIDGKEYNLPYSEFEVWDGEGPWDGWTYMTCYTCNNIVAHKAPGEDWKGNNTILYPCIHAATYGPHDHKYSWKYDETKHWQECDTSKTLGICKAVIANEGAHGDWTSAGRCGACNYACPHTGQTGLNCTVCGKYIHVCNLTYVAGKNATCTTEGWKEYYLCSGCGKVYEENRTSSTKYDSAEVWKNGAGKLEILPHVWEYSVVSNSIKVNCTRSGCTATDTLKSGSGPAYSGEAVSIDAETFFTWSGTYDDLATPVTGQWYYDEYGYGNSYTITTPDNCGAASEGGAPVNAGKYAIEVTVGSGEDAVTAMYPFTIYKESGSGTVTISDWTYGGMSSFPKTTSTTNPGYVLCYYKLVTEPDSAYTQFRPQDAGEYNIKAVFPANGDYAEYAAITSFTVFKGDAYSSMKQASGVIRVGAGSTKTISFIGLPSNATFGTVTYPDGNPGVTAVIEDGALKVTVNESGLPSDAGAFRIMVPVESRNYNDYEITVTVTPTTHIHNFNYSASGATLTAKCADIEKCELPYGVSLTIKAESVDYSGSVYNKASFAYTGSWTDAGLELPTINYVGRGTTEYNSVTPPTKVGTYSAQITVGGATASVDFAINKVYLVSDFNLVVPKNVEAPDATAAVKELSISAGSYSTQYLDAGWYVVSGDIDKTTTSITLRGDVNLILLDGKNLNVRTIDAGSYTLTIWGQSEGTGKIFTNYSYGLSAKNMIINGGNVNATGQYSGIRCTGSLTINGGTLNATATYSSGCAIDVTSDVVINNGTVNADDNGNGSGGIEADNAIIIKNGTVNVASESRYGFNANNSVVIDGGIVTITVNSYYEGIKTYGDIAVNGGMVTVYSNGSKALDASGSINIASDAFVQAGDNASSITSNEYSNQHYVKISGTSMKELVSSVDIDVPVYAQVGASTSGKYNVRFVYAIDKTALANLSEVGLVCELVGGKKITMHGTEVFSSIKAGETIISDPDKYYAIFEIKNVDKNTTFKVNTIVYNTNSTTTEGSTVYTYTLTAN